MSLNKSPSVMIFLGIFFALSSSLSQVQTNKNKTIRLSGKVHRSDTNQPIPGAKIEIWTSQRNALETKTDKEGSYSFEQVKAGKYKIRISVRYNRILDVPCKLGTGVTADKDSYVNMKDEGLGYVDVWVSINNFKILPGKPITKNFDVACKSSTRSGSKR